MENAVFEPSRRQVVAGLGGLGVAAGLSSVVGKVARADEAAAEGEEAGGHGLLRVEGTPLYELDPDVPAAPPVTQNPLPNLAIRVDSVVNRKDDLLEQLLQEAEPEGDVTLPDGRVVPAVYVKLRNHLNRVGQGCGSEVNAQSFDLFMYCWSEEDAENTCKIPLYRWTNAWDYSIITGKTVEESEEILYDLSQRGLICRTTRGQKHYYTLMPYIAGYWEATMMKAWYENDQDSKAIAELLSQNAMGSDYNYFSTGSQFPTIMATPVSADVVAEDEIQPYFDWRGRILKENFVAVAGCECMVLWEGVADINMRDRFPIERCLYLGEIGEYFVSIGAARQITAEEAIEIAEKAIEAGMVIEYQTGLDGNVICMCHCDVCLALRNVKANEGLNPPSMKNYSCYELQYDPDKCISCGACVDRCAMHCITLDEENKCVHTDVCVRCGQCVTVCPADARILKARDDFPYADMPYDYEIDNQLYFAKQRMQRGDIYDFTGTTIPENRYGVVTDSATRTSL